MSQSNDYRELIKKVSEYPEFDEIRRMPDFYFEKLRVLFMEFLSLDFSKPEELTKRAFDHYIKEGKESSFNLKSGRTDWQSLAIVFKKSGLHFKDYYSTIPVPSVEHYIFTLIGKLVAYFDKTGHDRSWNEFSPKRYVASSNVNQDDWINNLFKYKQAGNDINAVSRNIRHAIMYILKPDRNLTMLSIYHRERFSNNILKTTHHNDSFSPLVFEFFQGMDIRAENPMNNGVYYSQIIYSPEIKKLWLEESKSSNDPPPAEDENVPPAEGNEPEQVQQQAERDSFSSQFFAPTDNIPPTLGVLELAEELSGLLHEMGMDKGQMVGLFGQWGRGKTYLAEKTLERLEKEKHFIRVDFHAWKFQDTQASWAYLYECFAKGYFRKKSRSALVNLVSVQFRRFRLNSRRNGNWPWIFFLISLAATTAAFFIFDFRNADGKSMLDSLQPFISVSLLSFITAATAYFNFIKNRSAEKASDLVKKYFSTKSFNDLLGVQAEIEKELRTLLECWIPAKENEKPAKRILLFVDDIDRCSEDQIIRIIDALRVMLEDSKISNRVVVLAAIDERMLKRAIITKYYDMLKKEKDMAISSDSELKQAFESITQEYMDKLFISGIKLGILTSEDRTNLLSSILFSKKAKNGNTVTENKNKEETTTTTTPGNETSAVTMSDIGPEVPFDSGSSRRVGGIITTVAVTNQTAALPEQTQTTEQVKTENKTKSTELSKGEKDALHAAVAMLPEATPRKIRILYYRYLLAKNLLYEEMNDDDEFSPVSLANFLAIYSAPGAVKTIAIQKQKLVIDNKSDLVSIPVPREVSENMTIKMKPRNALKLFEVLEIVVAY
ncbi:MAG: KAP P-loop domain-containing protein [Bacteroidetes bacterium]|nr:MAG: KAP P-loop domain-containing protein [Bacteroidota bacterium]